MFLEYGKNIEDRNYQISQYQVFLANQPWILILPLTEVSTPFLNRIFLVSS